MNANRSETAPPRELTSQAFRDVIGHFASGVTVITTEHDGKPFGTTASAVTSLSLEPPMLVICMNRSSSTGQAVAAAGGFAVNILGEDQSDLAMRFAGKGDKFAGVEIRRDHAYPLLADALAGLVCEVTEQVSAGTHYVFLAEVHHATAQAGAPLAYFRGQFGRLELAQDEIIYQELRGRVFAHDIEVGTRLDAAEVAASLDVPRGPVYHALSKLASDGLVTREPDGTFVARPITMRTIEDVYHARRAIELGVADLTVGRVSQEAVAELRRLMEETAPLIAGGRFTDVERWAATNMAFHDYMVGLAGSDALLQAYRRLGLVGMDMRALNVQDAADEILIEDHRRLVEAYETGDVELARTVIDQHLGRPHEIRAKASAEAASDGDR